MKDQSTFKINAFILIRLRVVRWVAGFHQFSRTFEEHLDVANDTIFFRETSDYMITESFQVGKSWVHVISSVLIPLEVQLQEEAEELQEEEDQLQEEIEQLQEAIAQSLAQEDEEQITLDLDGLDL